MLQYAGRPLDEIAGILDATVADWKAIASRRLDLLNEEICRLEEARAYFAGALLCSHDHPAADCQVIGRLDRPAALVELASSR
jgi:hypothetical protein